MGGSPHTSHTSNHLKELDLDTQEAHNTALKLHAHSVLNAHDTACKLHAHSVTLCT